MKTFSLKKKIAVSLMILCAQFGCSKNDDAPAGSIKPSAANAQPRIPVAGVPASPTPAQDVPQQSTPNQNTSKNSPVQDVPKSNPTQNIPTPTPTPTQDAPQQNPVQNPTPAPTSAPQQDVSSIIPETNIVLDATGEAFQASIAAKLASAQYLEQSCVAVANYPDYVGFPLRRCQYTDLGQSSEVILLDPGPRRLTQWIEDACSSIASANLSTCMSTTYARIISESGAQFAVAGVVINDTNGNGIGEAYAYRNGVAVAIPSFTSGTEVPLTAAQIAASFTDTPTKTYSYASPVSLTREQLMTYASVRSLLIPAVGTTAQQLNAYNTVIGNLYRQAWMTGRNDIIRAWVSSQF